MECIELWQTVLRGMLGASGPGSLLELSVSPTHLLTSPKITKALHYVIKTDLHSS